MTYLVGRSGNGALGGVPGYQTIFTPPPLVSSLTWVNQSTATATDDPVGGTMLFSGPYGGGANNRRLLVKAAPATPWSFTIGFHPGLLISAATVPIVGVVARASGTGRFVEFVSFWSLQTLQFQTFRWTNPTTQSAVYTNLQMQPVASGGHPQWLRVSDTGVNLVWSYSENGREFCQYDSRVRTDWMAAGPDQYGIVLDGGGVNIAGNYVQARIFHWDVTSP